MPKKRFFPGAGIGGPCRLVRANLPSMSELAEIQNRPVY